MLMEPIQNSTLFTTRIKCYTRSTNIAGCIKLAKIHLTENFPSLLLIYQRDRQTDNETHSFCTNSELMKSYPTSLRAYCLWLIIFDGMKLNMLNDNRRIQTDDTLVTTR